MKIEKPIEQRDVAQKSMPENFWQVATLLWRAGMLFDTNRLIWRQLLELNASTNFVADEAHSLEIAEKIFKQFPGLFSEEDKAVVRKATVLSDIGKNGSVLWAREQRALIRRMYAVENVPDGHKLTVETFLLNPYREFYGLSDKEAQKELCFFEVFAAYDFECAVEKAGPGDLPAARDIPMPTFWSYGHVHWSLVGNSDHGAVAAAVGLHHLLDGTNPFHSISVDGVMVSGEKFNLPTALVAILDKYDAFVHRSDMSHNKAISILYSIVDKSMETGGLSQILTTQAKKEVADIYKKAIGLL